MGLYLYSSLIESFRMQYVPGEDSVSKKNDYQEYLLGGKGGRCLNVAAFSPLCANCLETLEVPNFWTAKVLSKLV